MQGIPEYVGDSSEFTVERRRIPHAVKVLLLLLLDMSVR